MAVCHARFVFYDGKFDPIAGCFGRNHIFGLAKINSLSNFVAIKSQVLAQHQHSWPSLPYTTLIIVHETDV
ncbi:hypothetical protein IC582_015402 [Cucumis melo]